MFNIDTFYRSKEWLLFRDIVIGQRINPNDGLLYCEECGEPILKPYDIILHHVIELTFLNVNDRNISLNQDNIKCVHHACHNRIHARFGYERYKKVYIVWGSPCSGKSSFVRKNAGPNDLVIDIDRIWECISNNPPYVKPDRLKVNAFAVRDALMEQVQFRKGKWQQAYIISGLPFQGERERLADKLNAELVFIDEPKETCLDRLGSCNDGRDKEAWRKYIEQWFENYSTSPPI